MEQSNLEPLTFRLQLTLGSTLLLKVQQVGTLCTAPTPAVYFVVVGLFVILFALYLADVLLHKKRPKDAERHVTMFGFLVLVPTILTQHLPPMILPILSLFFAAYLHKAR